MQTSTEVFLSVKKISKSFAENKVLSDVSLDIRPGEYHALIGENGAGKSTLINLITGIHQYDSGVIEVGGRAYEHMTPLMAQKLGIFTVHQELSINPFLTVSENIFLGNEIKTHGFLDKNRMRDITSQILNEMGLPHVRPDDDAESLTMADRQMVEFCKAVYQKPRLLILDEATSALDGEQVNIMFAKLKALKATGMMVIFISHRLHELFETCDIMTVLKDGQQITTEPIKELEEDRLVTLMTGRTLGDLFPPKRDRREIEQRPEVISARGLSFGDSRGMDFCLHEGEILGIGGLQGQGQQELLECLFGMKRVKDGELKLNGKPVKFNSAADAMRHDIAYLPAERKTEGLFIGNTIRYNISFANLEHLCSGIGTIIKKKEDQQIEDSVRDFEIKIADSNQLVNELSGGNQQKVVLANWMARNPKILLLNEPTRGIDVGTKKEIYELLYRLAQEGVSIIVISSDTMELIGICDRILVIYEHQINGELYSEEMSEEALVKASVFRKEAVK